MWCFSETLTDNAAKEYQSFESEIVMLRHHGHEVIPLMRSDAGILFALLVRRGDGDALAAAIRRICKMDADSYAQLAQNARILFEERYTREEL